MASETAAAGAAKTDVAGETGNRGDRRVVEGIVLSDVRQKTITVEIKRLVKHARYGKYIFRSTNLHAHDEKNEAKKGDRVEIVETRPISKQKRWRLVRVIERAVVLGTLDIKEVDVTAKKQAPVAAAPKPEAGSAPEAKA
jgi:small subunit ribosomal protein S17